MRNNCVDREKIFALAQGMLAEREQPEVSAHVAACDGCRQVLQSYKRIDSVLEEWLPAAEPSPWFEARLRARVAEQETRTSRSFLGLSWSRWLAAPALASLLLVATLAVLRSGRITNLPRPNVAPKPALVAANPPTAPVTQAQVANQELKMYQNLPVLEDYDMLANFDVISELPKGNHKIAD